MVKVLGLFPGTLNPAVFGGVEEAGRIAWDAIQRSHGSDRCSLFCYDPKRTGADSNHLPGIFTVHTKTAALMIALRRTWPAGIVLVWHLGLLPILPFLRLGNAKVVVFLHGIEAWQRHSRLSLRMLRRADLFLTNSTYTWERFVGGNPQFQAYPHRTVHLGLGTPLANAGGYSDLKPVAAMIARLESAEDYKGHREMIAAWRLVNQRIPEAELWVVGGGNLRPTLETLAKEAGVSDKVRFLGRVPDDKKQEILRQCRCLALPSRGEGFGLVYLEAMRYAKPCLVSTVDAGREVVAPPEAGLAVQPDNPREIADATCRLLNGGAEWAGFSERAGRRYESQFTASHFQQRLLEALCL